MAETAKSAKGTLTRSPVLLGKFTPPAQKRSGGTGTSAGTGTSGAIDIYSSVTARAIKALELTKAEKPKSRGEKLEVRGTKGAGSIKVAKKPGGVKYSIPVPGWFKIEDMRAFVKNKIKTADSFTAPSGRVYSV